MRGLATSLSTSDAGEWGYKPATTALAHWALGAAFVIIWLAVAGDANAALYGFAGGYIFKEVLGDIRRDWSTPRRWAVRIDSVFDTAVSLLGCSAIVDLAAGEFLWAAWQAGAACLCAGFILLRGARE